MFFFPLRDDNPTSAQPFVSWAILALCVAVFFVQLTLGTANNAVIYALGMIPARIFGGEGELTLISSMFLHGGFMHLAGNMLYLWIFADNVEDSVGHGKFAAFYVLCGIAAALAQALTDTASTIPMIGASGAIAGVLGAYLMLHPRANVRCIIVIFIFFRLINIPAFIVLGGWLVLQFLSLGQIDSSIAYVAHIGGFIAGAALIVFFKKPEVALFDKPHSRAFEVSGVSRHHIPSVKRGRNPFLD